MLRNLPARTLAPTAVAVLVTLLGGCVSDPPMRSTDCPARPVDMPGADVSARKWIGCDLRDANLRGTNLAGSLLWYSDLRDADLRDANLRGTNLSNADLRGADLRGADLTDAWLSGVEMNRGGMVGVIGCPYVDAADGRCTTDLARSIRSRR